MMIHVSDCTECSVTELAAASSALRRRHQDLPAFKAAVRRSSPGKSYAVIDMLFETKDD
jgi:hypothetical protein